MEKGGAEQNRLSKESSGVQAETKPAEETKISLSARDPSAAWAPEESNAATIVSLLMSVSL
jgi:hypothetical protein